MKFPSPFTADFWVDRDPNCVKYDHEPKVIPFPGPVARANAAQSAQLLEDHRMTFEAVPSRAEERRLWNAYMAAIRKSVSAQDEVNDAHRAWMKAAGNVPNPTT